MGQASRHEAFVDYFRSRLGRSFKTTAPSVATWPTRSAAAAFRSGCRRPSSCHSDRPLLTTTPANRPDVGLQKTSPTATMKPVWGLLLDGKYSGTAPSEFGPHSIRHCTSLAFATHVAHLEPLLVTYPYARIPRFAAGANEHDGVAYREGSNPSLAGGQPYNIS